MNNAQSGKLSAELRTVALYMYEHCINGNGMYPQPPHETQSRQTSDLKYTSHTSMSRSKVGHLLNDDELRERDLGIRFV